MGSGWASRHGSHRTEGSGDANITVPLIVCVFVRDTQGCTSEGCSWTAPAGTDTPNFSLSRTPKCCTIPCLWWGAHTHTLYTDIRYRYLFCHDQSVASDVLLFLPKVSFHQSVQLGFIFVFGDFSWTHSANCRKTAKAFSWVPLRWGCLSTLPEIQLCSPSQN